MHRYQGIQSQAEHWQLRKAHRLQEFTSLQVQYSTRNAILNSLKAFLQYDAPHDVYRMK